jgi:formylglycine-generating enzyme required for sulfatase activity
VVECLAEDGKVLPVRLALFADMVKDKPWDTTTFEGVGGTDGVGLKFLDDAFTTRAANPDYRLHEVAARCVLKALLPEVGSDIRGHMRSRAELLQASGYQDRPSDFNSLLRILDGELRLLTPTDSVGSRGGSSGVSGQYYQLTHDYLVPLLREWLTRRQQETRQGRAEIRLAERAAIWSMKRERRHLPSMWEYIWIAAWTSAKNHTEAEGQMMAAAARFHGYRAIVACLLTFATVAAATAFGNRIAAERNLAKAHGRVDQLLVAEIAEVPGIVRLLENELQAVGSRLAAVADDPKRSIAERLRATMALVDGPGGRADQLVELASSADVSTIAVIRNRLAPFAKELQVQLWSTVRSDRLLPSARLRFAALLTLADAEGGDWKHVAPSIVDALLEENTFELDSWIEMLRPIAPALVPQLQEVFFDPSTTSGSRVAAARVLARYADAELLTKLLLQSDASRFSLLLPGTSQHRTEMVDSMQRRIRSRGQASNANTSLQDAAQVRNAAVTLFRLGQTEDVEPVMTAAGDPTPRTMLILEMRDFGVPLRALLDAFAQWRDPVARQAILLAMGPYLTEDPSAADEQTLRTLAGDLLEDGTRQSERSAAEWLLGRLGDKQPVAAIAEAIRSAPPTTNSRSQRDWWITQEGHTMLIVPARAATLPPQIDAASNGSAPATVAGPTILRDFAVSVHEVTIGQFRRFRADADFALDGADDPQCPANKVSYHDAVRYCQWLSEQEGIPEHERCYGDQIDATPASLPEDRLQRTGYRLLTEAEWEYVCRAGSTTSWYCGVDESYLDAFAWFARNARERQHPVGSLRPNPSGVFDIVGNVGEWCHATVDDGQFALRGGAFSSPASTLRSAERYTQTAAAYSYTGFRIARTISSPP